MLVKVNIDRICNREKPLAGDVIVHRVINFDANTGKEIFDSLNKAVALGQQIFPVVVDSYGGQAYSLMAAIEAFRSSPIPVATIVEGKAMSCGAFLAAFGTPGYRYIGQNSHILIHHVSNWVHGIVPQIKVTAKHTDEIDRYLFEMLSRHCGHEPDFFQRKLRELEGADWYVSPNEALFLNLVDHVGSPTFEINLRAESRIYAS